MAKYFIFILFILAALPSCKPWQKAVPNEQLPIISPNYNQATVPCNIAPLNFYINMPGDNFVLEVTGQNKINLKLKSAKGDFDFPLKQWKSLLANNTDADLNLVLYRKMDGAWEKFKPMLIHISSDSISPYIAYRSIDPGNIFWKKMGIYQRCLENFDESPIITNNLTKNGCVNCHSFANYNPEKFQLHFRKIYSGTLIANNGKVDFINTKTPYTLSNATYPAWHPSGKYIAYSVNKIFQKFFSQTNKFEMVHDSISDIILYNLEKNSISSCPQLSTESLENIPSWSHQGDYMYYISGNRFKPVEYQNNKYDLLRIAFDESTEKWGRVDTLLSSKQSGFSYSFPSPSPNGKFILYSMANYGYFAIHNKESDIGMLNLETKENKVLSCNSSHVESYPIWSANGKWIMFVSKRTDDLFSRPWFCHINDDGEVGESFVLPQKDPHFYDTWLLNFNRPEFINGKVQMNPQDILKVISKNTPEMVSYDTSQHVDVVSGATCLQE